MHAIILTVSCLFIKSVVTVNSINEEAQLEYEISNIDILAEQAQKLPIEDFIDDPELTQHVDYINKVTLYKRLEKKDSSGKGQHAEVVYERKAVDRGKMVIVLTSAEDNLKVVIRKRTYVILRQNPITNRTYFASYAYIRHSVDSIGCAEWDNELRCIEWDTWDNSRETVKAKSKYFGWTNCASSFLASCTFNESQEQDYRDRMQPATQNNKDKKEKEGAELPEVEFQPAPGYENDDSIDIFADLDVDPAEAQYMSQAVRLAARQGTQGLLKTEGGLLARAFGGELGRALMKTDKAKVTSQMKAAKEKAISQAGLKGKAKKLLKAKLLDRDRLLKRKKELNFRLMQHAKQSGLGSLWKIKKDNQLTVSFLGMETATDLMKELKMIENSLGNVSNKTEKDFFALTTNGDKKLAIQEVAEEDANADAGELTSLAGNTLNEVAGRTFAGRSVGNSDAAAALGRSIANGLLSTSTDLFSNPGWKMQSLVTATENISLIYENITFYGFGGCKTSKFSHEAVHSTDISLNELIDLYLQILKTSCTKEVKEYVLHLLQIHYLEKDANLLIVPEDLVQLKKAKLNATELQQLSSSLELSVFMRTFVRESAMWIYEPMNSIGQPISRSAYFIIQLGLNIINEARQKTPLHFIKICRNFVLTLKMTLTNLLQDFEILQEICAGCKNDLEINSNDTIYIYGLVEFIIRGLLPVEMGEHVWLEFEEFFVRNLKAVEYQVNLYM